MSDLERFPRPAVAVDLAILTVTGAGGTDPELRIFTQSRTDPDGRALPGAFLRERTRVSETADYVLREKVGIAPHETIRPRLLRLFDDPERDGRTWAVSAAHALPLPESALSGANGDLTRVTIDGRLEGVDSLLFDHDSIVDAAIRDVRERYEIRLRYVDVGPDPDGFLAEPFTLLQLRRVHEAVIGEALHKDNFARRMRPHLESVVDDDGEVALSTALRGRPAALFRRAR
ncbi:NUDIX hydrolase [Dietzia cercidiphylli]|uniref:NUDIX domain-containing protein n=1 Tax=Dietzia cercidiphylli TaxID=498199 RepID=A0ABP4UPK2_9ACTN|nr:NUDIX hydrolase [Dietzia cercidiphylli]MBB1047757.1 NUDIX hydrolase [Dietzia cercidiphylli]